MKKHITLTLIIFFLSGCSFIHKNDVVQGNVVTPEDVSQLHRGMNESHVKGLLGTPLLVNVFTKDQVAYVYTYQAGRQPMQINRLTLRFRQGVLQEIVRS